MKKNSLFQASFEEDQLVRGERQACFLGKLFI
jgi:hypothetical protein